MIKKLVFIVFMFLNSIAKPEVQDKVAHFGVSYALTAVGYGLAKTALGTDRIDSVLLSAFMVFMVGISKETLDALNTNSGYLDGGDIGANSLGIGCAALTVLIFNF
jgi:hypothetical protein